MPGKIRDPRLWLPASALLLLPLLAAETALAQSGNSVSNMSFADLKNQDPALVAAQHLAKAERALLKAEGLLAEGGEDPKAAKKARSAFERAEREATAAINKDPTSIRAYVVRGRALLRLDQAGQARGDCLMGVSHGEKDAEALLCYARANLALGEGGQALAAHGRMIEEALDPELAARLLTEIRAWIDRNPEGEKEANAARVLSLRGLGDSK